jgi:hypothetical protein
VPIPTVYHALPLDGSRIQVGLQLEHRQKGLLWFSTYKVSFDGVYYFRNPTGEDHISITLFTVMQMTGKIRWPERFERKLA